MLILDGCGWIPTATVKFAYNIINLIKILTPVILVLMGSIDFAKAVIAQDSNQIKKAQVAFIKKLIAGVAVFFVVVFAQWMVNILEKAGATGSSESFKCVKLLLTGEYEAEDKTYYEQQTTTTTNTTIMTCETCKQKYAEEIKNCVSKFEDNAYETNQAGYKKAYENCENNYETFRDEVGKYYDECVDSKTSNEKTCNNYQTNIEIYINEYNLNYNYKSTVLCDIALTKEEKNNCYSYETYHQACYTYATGEQENGNEENYCIQDYCKICSNKTNSSGNSSGNF